jgi:hypothetical protein
VKTRKASVTALVTGLVLVAPGLGLASPSGARVSVAAQARHVVGEFFQTINARQFGKTCDLLSRRFYEQNDVPDRKHCVLGLTIGFTMSPEIHFRILDVHESGDEVIVRALANGAPGRIVLVREGAGYKILSVGS